MINQISTERIFSLSCLEGLRLLRKHEAQHPSLTVPELVSLVERVEADAQSLDLEASAHLSPLIECEADIDSRAFYQICIKEILLKRQPAWAKTMKRGRKRFAAELSPDDRAIFDAAGLTVDSPSHELIEWWDDISGQARLTSNLVSMRQGRAAELLTIESERTRLKSIGISKEPEWLGLDDNFAGYDVLTYDKSEMGLVNKLIEVKSTIASPPRFFVSRSEWQKAEQSGKTYSFHIWEMQRTPPQLHIRSVADVAPHIPTDNGRGRWTTAEVRVT